VRRLLERLTQRTTDASRGPEAPPGISWRQTLAGRLFLLSGALVLILFVWQRFSALPEFLVLLRKVATIALVGAGAWVVGVGIARNRRAFLWRVRRKLILSYVFLGVVPVVLVLVFALAGGVVLYNNVTTYVFKEAMSDLADDIYQVAETSAIELGRAPATSDAALLRKYQNLAAQYPGLSMAAVPLSRDPRTRAQVVTSGAWRHMPAPTDVPDWLSEARRTFKGLIAFAPPDAADDMHLVVRAAVQTPDGKSLVIADLPVDTDVITRLDERTATRLGAISVPKGCGGLDTTASLASPVTQQQVPFRKTVSFMDCTDWTTGKTGSVSMSITAPLRQLYGRIASAQIDLPLGGWNSFLAVLVLLGMLFLVVQGAALVVGGALAKTITSAVHELFVGTERVQQGDFTHRINIESRDQLGDLADSFNRMSASIEHLLHVQREKQRLDDELRIAREIQKSLLPVQLPQIPGLDIADLCEPAREVGGDYYDFFEIGPRQLGVMIADVSGKGTSAALYMAELKGLMLALSHSERSPRKLLIDVNRRLVGHLDNRSFITMTYAVIDLDAGTMTCARAGHTPLVVVSDGKSEVLTPDGMVLGLRLPGADHRFEEILQEHVQPLRAGDVIVLYTDGITEAMDATGELFGDAALARVLSSHPGLDAAGIRERVLREVKAFVGDAEPHDDMTMVVLKIEAEARSAAA
jgi:sigma-B regulation protein RsbU (phosphoserine phosphatase)